MPELVTKYPDQALKILKDAGIQCGMHAPQKILTTCPPEHFCKLPTGEICVYGVNDVNQMTQLNAIDLFAQINVILPLLAVMILIFALAMMLGMKMK